MSALVAGPLMPELLSVFGGIADMTGFLLG
jgi:hypothetical protein